jgi:hypothetical protein
VEGDLSWASSCSGCGSTSFAADPAGVPVCEYCRAPYTPPTRDCHRCASTYEPGAARCPSCGAELARECPACGALVPFSVRHCLVCGLRLDAADAVFTRLSRGTPDQLRHMRELGATIKAKEEAASKARMARMWAEEERHREKVARARAERVRRERLTVALTVAVGVIVVVIAIVVAILATKSSPVPLSQSSGPPFREASWPGLCRGSCRLSPLGLQWRIGILALSPMIAPVWEWSDRAP